MNTTMTAKNTTPSEQKTKATNLPWLWLSFIIIFADQASKWLAVHMLTLYEPVKVLPFFNLTLAHNRGAAFSFLSSQNGWQQWVFGAIALIVCGMIVLWLYRLPRRNTRLAIGLTLILGGALGNLWDRLTLGYVVDFIQLHVGLLSWPVFNVADSSICIGAVLLMMDILRKARNYPKYQE